METEIMIILITLFRPVINVSIVWTFNIVSDCVLKMSRSSQGHDGDMEILFYERSYDKIKYKDS